MTDDSYFVSQTVLDTLSSDELEELLAVRSLDLGWWARFYGIEDMSEEQRQRLVDMSDEELDKEWRTELTFLKMGDLLAEYADGYYRGTNDLLNAFIEKSLVSDSEAMPILMLVSQFIELVLKASIQYMMHFHQNLGNTISEIDINTHNLSNLLPILEELFEPNELILSDETKQFILKIHEINEMCQAFRYPFSHRVRRSQIVNNVFLVNAPLIPMGLFKAEFEVYGDELKSFLILFEDRLFFSDTDRYFPQT